MPCVFPGSRPWDARNRNSDVRFNGGGRTASTMIWKHTRPVWWCLIKACLCGIVSVVFSVYGIVFEFVQICVWMKLDINVSAQLLWRRLQSRWRPVTLPSLCYTVTVLQCYSVTVLQCYSVSPSLTTQVPHTKGALHTVVQCTVSTNVPEPKHKSLLKHIVLTPNHQHKT